MSGIKILGTGSYVPPKIVRNEDFTKIIETSDEWIKTRTGMSERHMSEGEPTWYMGAEAAKKAVEASGIDISEIGLIISSTVTADFYTPSNACIIQRELGAIGCIAFDISCACAGFVYGIDMAKRYMQTDKSLKYVLVVSSENMSKMVDFTDRSTCVLFGDGAAACVLKLTEENDFYSSYLGADGNGAKAVGFRAISPNNIFMPKEKKKIDDDIPEGNGHYLFQDGKEVYKFAVKALPNSVNGAAEKLGITAEQLDWIIPHQANIRIIETASQNLGIPMDKFIINIEKYGNTSSASIPIALDEAVRSGKIKRGDKICMVGFGSGLVYGAAIFEY